MHRGLVAELAGNTTTAAFVAGDPDRVYPLVIPQKKNGGAAQTPCVVYQMRNVERQVTYCGVSGLVREEMQLDCYATAYDDAKDLADAVRELLSDFSGLLGGIVPVRHAALTSETDLQDPEPGLYRVSQFWVFWHEE